MEKQIDFYFDVVSPYSYVASKLIEDVAQRSNAQLQWKPLLLGGIFKAVGTPNEYYKFTLKMPADFPVRTVLAMRVLSGLTPEKIPQAAHSLFDAYWVDNLDIADPEVVASLVGQDAVEQAGMHDIKKALFQTTEEAVKRGAFGAPTFFVGDEMFFGHDRLYLLEEYLLTNL